MLSFELKGALEKNRLYQSLEPQELDLLVLHSQVVHFSPGETIIRQGSSSGGIYLILEGTVTIAGQIVGEGVTHLGSLRSGQIFGGSSVILKGPNTISMLAETAVQCLLVSEKYLEVLSLFYPGTKYKIMREVAVNVGERIKLVAEKVLDFMSSTEMMKRSIFGEVIKSLTKPSLLSFEEAGIEPGELQALFPASQVDEILGKASLIKTASQCPLIYEGEESTDCYLILRGAVQSSLVKQKKVAKVSILGPLSLFCPLSFIDVDGPSLINYRSCERAILLKLEKAKLDEIRLKNLGLWYHLFDLMVESLVLLEKYLEKLDIRVNSEIYNR